MKRLAPIAFAALLLGGAARAADGPQGAGERVDALLREWHEAPQSIDDLEGRLVALGGDASARLAALLDQARDDDDPLPVGAVAHAFARLAQGPSVDCLARLLRSSREADRVAAVVALAEVSTPEATALVLATLKSEARAEAAAAADAVARAGSLDPRRAPDAAFTHSLRDAPNADVIGGFLGRIGTSDAHETLLELLARSSPDLQSAAMDGLWDFALADDRESVRSFLWTGRSAAVRKKAALLLGHLRDADAIPDLIGLLGEEDAGLSSNAGWALREITGQILESDRELWSEWWDRGGETAMEARAAKESTPAGLDESEAATPTLASDDAPVAELVPRAEPVRSALAFVTGPPFLAGALAAALCAAAIGWTRSRAHRRAHA